MSEFDEHGERSAPRVPPPGRSDDADLRASLGDLAGLVTDTLGLPELLEQVAMFAARAIPGADGAGVTLLAQGQPSRAKVEVIAASEVFVRDIDRIQYAVLNEGPCITAALERRTVRSGELVDDPNWPRFGPRAAALGVHSALSLPLALPQRVVGAINIYARAAEAFDERAAELAELFAAPAAVAVHNAQVLDRARQLTAQLQTALTTRPVIDQAIGILLARAGGTADQAFEHLRTISQHENVKVAVLARRIVDEAVSRARARHAQP